MKDSLSKLVIRTSMRGMKAMIWSVFMKAQVEVSSPVIQPVRILPLIIACRRLTSPSLISSSVSVKD